MSTSNWQFYFLATDPRPRRPAGCSQGCPHSLVLFQQALAQPVGLPPLFPQPSRTAPHPHVQSHPLETPSLSMSQIAPFFPPCCLGWTAVTAARSAHSFLGRLTHLCPICLEAYWKIRGCPGDLGHIGCGPPHLLGCPRDAIKEGVSPELGFKG